ncbi:hypothetical protein ALO74_02078, partial [Pseudomonas syringae pv. cunninghamiae]
SRNRPLVVLPWCFSSPLGTAVLELIENWASLFDHLMESNAVAVSVLVHGVNRPKVETNEGSPPCPWRSSGQASARGAGCPVH